MVVHDQELGRAGEHPRGGDPLDLAARARLPPMLIDEETEATAALGLVRQRAQHLTFGEFSQKFASVAKGAPFLDDPIVVSAGIKFRF